MTDLLLAYAEAHTTPESPILARLNRETHLSQVYPQMLSGHLQGALLRMIVRMIRPERVLEIGTFTGYSAIAMTMGMLPYPAIDWKTRLPLSPAGTKALPAPHKPGERNGMPLLHTIEVNPELEDGIRSMIREAGMEEHIILHMGEALGIIPDLKELWDLVFIDADKTNYLNYYKMVLPRMRPGSFLIADNVLWDGKVLGDPDKMDKDTHGIFDFNEFVQQDTRVEKVMLPLRDGLTIIRKIDQVVNP